MKKILTVLLLVLLASGCLCTGGEKKAVGCDNFTLTVGETRVGNPAINSTELADYCWSYNLANGTCDLKMDVARGCGLDTTEPAKIVCNNNSGD